ncbi:MAG: response regulator [Acetobacteraceae bacterium]|nr:response regulator [Acetobacteraceae bacterium]
MAMESMIEAISRHLPMLRRFARAAVGGQAAGDALVRESMPALVAAAGGGWAPGIADLRGALFAALVTTIRNSTIVAFPSPAGAPLSQALATLAPAERDALLLTTLEGFSEAEAAAILSATQAAVRDWIAQAREVLRRLEPARVLIIEDDDLIAEAMARVVTTMGHSVVHRAIAETEALVAARASAPHLVLADIQLGEGGDGLNAAQAIVAESPVPVIFVTGFPERLLTGEAPEPAFVVSKPYREETLRTAIGQALATRARA